MPIRNRRNDPQNNTGVDANQFVTSGAGTVGSPWILNTSAIDAVADGTTIIFRANKNYGVVSSSGLRILHGKQRVSFRGNGATLWNASGAELDCLISIGAWNNDGTPTPSDTAATIAATVRDFVFNGGVHGVTRGLRINSGHFCLYENLDIRNYKKFGALNLGGVQSDFNRIYCNNDQLGGTFTRYFTPETAIQISGSPSTTGIWTPSTITLRHFEGRGHSKDGCRIFDAFNTHIASSAFEGAVQGPEYGAGDGATSTPPYTGDNSYLDQELYTKGNKGCGIYIGANTIGTVITNTDCEECNNYPNGGGYKMGIIVDDGARDTLLENCYAFDSMTCVNNGAAQTTIIGGNQPMRLNGQGVRLIGAMYEGSRIAKGPNLKNYYHMGGDYANFLFDKFPAAEIGGLVIGYDPYTNGGPVESQTYVCIYNKNISGGGYPDYLVMQEANGNTRLGGNQVTIGCHDVANMTFQNVGGVSKLAFFGGAAIAKPAVIGSRSTLAAAYSAIQALAALNLVTDSTTA